jgi:tetratricopeptide (TPR) repeat protein
MSTAGRRALGWLDFGSAARLLERAAALAPASEVDLALETDLIDALTGTKIDKALARARSVAERSAAADDRVGELCGRIHEAVLRISVKPAGAADALEALVLEALPVFEAAGDELALRIAYRALGSVANMRAHMDRMAAAYEQAAAHAAPAGGTALVGYQGHARFHGSTPLTELLAWLDEQDPREQRTYWLRTFRMSVLAMLGRFDEARAVLDELRAEVIERGARTVHAAVEGYAMYIELLADDLAAAVAAGETGCRIDEELGHSSELSTLAGSLARVYCDAGRLEDAEHWASRAAELGSTDDASTQMLWRDAQALVEAHRGQHATAERLAREAVQIGEQTEALNAQAETYADLGEVLALASRRKKAAAALEQALARYEAKENLVMAGLVRERLGALRTEVG